MHKFAVSMIPGYVSRIHVTTSIWARMTFNLRIQIELINIQCKYVSHHETDAESMNQERNLELCWLLPSVMCVWWNLIQWTVQDMDNFYHQTTVRKKRKEIETTGESYKVRQFVTH